MGALTSDTIQAIVELRRQVEHDIVCHSLRGNNPTLRVIAAGITPDHFMNDAYGIVFGACQETLINGDEVSFTTISAYLIENKLHDRVNQSIRLVDLLAPRDNAPLKVLVEKLDDHHKRGQILQMVGKLGDSTTMSLDRDISEILSEIILELHAIQGGFNSSEITGFGNIELEEWAEKPDSDGLELKIGKTFDRMYRMAPGQLVIVTGHPNSGKSHFASLMCANAARHHDMKALMWSAEHDTASAVMKVMRPTIGRPPKEYDGSLDTGWREAMPWHEQHFRYFKNAADSNSLATILSMSQTLIQSWPFQILYIDPWTDLSTERPAYMSETEWHGNMIGKLRSFTKRHGLTTIVVAHPVKSIKFDEVPNLKTVNGSAHFNNMADVGITVWNESFAVEGADRNHNEIHVTKMREQAQGRTGKCEFDWGPTTWQWYPSDEGM